MRNHQHSGRMKFHRLAPTLLPAMILLLFLSVLSAPCARAMFPAMLPDAGQMAASERGGLETYWHMGELFIIVYSNDPSTMSRVDYLVWYWEMRGVSVKVFFALLPEPAVSGHISYWSGWFREPYCYPYGWCDNWFYCWWWIKPPPGDGWVPPPGNPPLRPDDPTLRPADPPLLLARTMHHKDGTTSTVRFALAGSTVLDERAIATATGMAGTASIGERIAGIFSSGGGSFASSSSGSSISSSSSSSSSGPSSSSGGGGGVSSKK